ncbi:MAG: outer membrane protein assembly factor BamE [Nitrospinota bacterium]|nr:outer membrane protein assembly factor BamE [Nitrospinota bacterium]
MAIDRGTKGIGKILTNHYFILLLLIAPLFISSCASVGRDFPEARVSRIQIGKTTKKEIQRMFGPPWRVGIEDGSPTWTYGKYNYRILGDSSTKDLVIRFDDNGVVTSYVFNTTEPQE